jgi:hypothetical protein
MRLEEYFNKTFLGTLFLWRDAHTRIGASSNRCKEYLLLASRLGKAAECPWRIRGDLRRVPELDFVQIFQPLSSSEAAKASVSTRRSKRARGIGTVSLSVDDTEK